jgi:hypothetical protein
VYAAQLTRLNRDGQVQKYLNKALNERQGMRGSLLDQVVQFVSVHWFDIVREEQWRTDMTRQIGQVEMLLNKVALQSSSIDKRLDDDMLVRRIGALLQEKIGQRDGAAGGESFQRL